MPLSDIPSIPQDANPAMVIDYLIMLRRKLNDFLNHLDTLNVEELDADVIIANTITAAKIAAGTITATELSANSISSDKIQAGAVTALKIAVTQLSAIAADLGTVTAGDITTNANINVGTDLNVGKSIYLNASSFQSTIYLTPSVYIYFDPAAASLRMVAPGGVYANGKRIDI